jgi:hypothetical protein
MILTGAPVLCGLFKVTGLWQFRNAYSDNGKWEKLINQLYLFAVLKAGNTEIILNVYTGNGDIFGGPFTGALL